MPYIKFDCNFGCIGVGGLALIGQIFFQDYFLQFLPEGNLNAWHLLTRAQKDQGTPFSYSPFDPPSNKVPQIVEIIMLEYLRVPRNFLGLWPLR